MECKGGLQEPGPPVVLPYTGVYRRTTVVFGLQCRSWLTSMPRTLTNDGTRKTFSAGMASYAVLHLGFLDFLLIRVTKVA